MKVEYRVLKVLTLHLGKTVKPETALLIDELGWAGLKSIAIEVERVCDLPPYSLVPDTWVTAGDAIKAAKAAVEQRETAA